MAKFLDARDPRQLRTMLMQRHSSLETDRAPWMTHWSDISRVVLPRNYRAFATDRNNSSRALYNKIYDNTGTRSVRVAGAGMMAGASSPARPWMRLTTADPDLADFAPVRIWLDDVSERMLTVFARSNVYRFLHQAYEELVTFGTACGILRPDPTTVIRMHPVVCGQFSLAQNPDGEINALYREYERTVAEVVQEFGLEACSTHVQSLYRAHNLQAPVRILHVIEPRPLQQRDPNSLTAQNMPWRSVHLELYAEDNKILRDSGFERFPVLAPRWAVAGGDTYGHSPGMEALGDLRQLQQEQLRKGQAIDYKVRPPLQVPTSLRDREGDMFPGGISYYEPGMMVPYDQVGPNAGIRSAFEVNLDTRDLLEDIQDVRERIRSSFFADLFLMLSMAGTNTRMTATEVAERHEEKLLMLGPTLERLHNELLHPLVDLTFDYMQQAGLIPPAPPDLDGQPLDVEFVSILAQAQKAVGTSAVDRFVGNVMQVSQVKPEVLDKVNWDKWVEHYGHDLLGVEGDLIVPDAQVRQLREARARAEAAQAQALMAREQAATAKDLANAPTDQRNALTDALDTLTGGGA